MKTTRILLIAFLVFFWTTGEAINTWQTAVLISHGETKTGTMSSQSGQTVNWYKLEVTQDGTVSFDITPGSGLSIRYISLYTKLNDAISERNYIYVYTEPKTFTVTDVAAGIYYVKLFYQTGQGSYSLKYTFTSSSYANDPEPNNSFDLGSMLSSGNTVQGHFGYYYNSYESYTEDWYKIEVPKNGTVSFDITPGSGLSIRYISLNTKLNDAISERNYIYVYTEPKTFTVTDVAAGIYYVKLVYQAGHGGYSLNYSFTANKYPNDTEPNDTYLQAQPIKEGVKTTGQLGYGYNSRDGEDWYKITLTEKGNLNVNFKPDSTSSLSINYIELFSLKDNKTASKGYVYVGKLEKNISLNNSEPGDYLLKVLRSSGEGSYTLYYGQAIPIAGAPIRIDVVGRSAVRKGAPNRYTVKMNNISGERTSSFMLCFAVTEDIHFLGAEIPSKSGTKKLTLDDELESTNATAQSFFIPYLDPFETYSFDVLVEGAANAKVNVVQAFSPQQTELIGTAIVVGAVLVYGAAQDKIEEWVCNKVNEKVDLSPQEAELYAQAMGISVKDMNMQKEKDGIGAFATKSVIKTAVKEASNLNPLTAIVAKVGSAVETASSVSQSLRRRLFYWFYSETGLIDTKKLAVADGKLAADRVVTSWDPNEKLGPKGYGANNQLANVQRMNYTILFENKKEATAPAYKVYIEDTLSELFDPNTIQFESTSHSGEGYYWLKEQDSNKLKWTIEGIELPPNVTPPQGEGFVSFSVELKPGIASGTAITNNATIIFDKNPAISTNTWTNMLDMLAPVTTMKEVNHKAGENEVTVSCLSDDNINGSGINRYLFYVSENEAPFRFIEESNVNAIKFPIDTNKEINYRFYAIAIDNTGNVEQNLPTYASFKIETGIQSISQSNIRVFPNPSEGKFTLQLDENSDTMLKYVVYSTLGQLILSTNNIEPNDANAIEIDLTNYPAGIYFVNLTSNNKTQLLRLNKK